MPDLSTDDLASGRTVSPRMSGTSASGISRTSTTEVTSSAGEATAAEPADVAMTTADGRPFHGRRYIPPAPTNKCGIPSNYRLHDMVMYQKKFVRRYGPPWNHISQIEWRGPARITGIGKDQMWMEHSGALVVADVIQIRKATDMEMQTHSLLQGQMQTAQGESETADSCSRVAVTDLNTYYSLSLIHI